MNTKILEKLGQNFKKYRLKKGPAQEFLAEKVRIHPTYVGKLESSKNNPSIKMLYKITRTPEIKLPELFDFDK